MAPIFTNNQTLMAKTNYFVLIALLMTCFFSVDVCSLSPKDVADGGGERTMLSGNHLPTASFAKINHHRQRHHAPHLSSSQHGQQSSMLEFTAKLSGDSTPMTPTSSTPMMGCKELRSKRYISDGQCTSLKPIAEVVCAGFCLPVSKLPWYAQYADLWESTSAARRRVDKATMSMSAADDDHSPSGIVTGNGGDSISSDSSHDNFQCVDGAIKRRRIQLTCQDGQQRSYVIRTVRGCKCKKHRSRSSPFSIDNKTVL